MSFRELNLSTALVRNLDAMGYVEPRPIQAQAISSIAGGRDLVGLARTGTGKTAAFVVPVADRLLRQPPPKRPRRPVDAAARLRAVVLCPTRELAEQVEREAASIVRGTVLRTAVAVGKSAIGPQAEAIATGVDLLVATPGRLRELLDDGLADCTHVRVLVLDEADRMMDMGFRPQVDAIIDRLPAREQTLLFTATMPAEVEALATRLLDHPVRVEVDPHTTVVEHVSQRVLRTADLQKVPLLLHLLGEDRRRRGVLVFCRTRRRVGWVGAALARHGIAVGMLHGDRTQAQRRRALDRFTAGELQVLVATDVAARGLHIEAVRTVVNYDVPMQPEEHVHRVGRAGHGTQEAGEAVTFLTGRDEERWATTRRIVGVGAEPEILPGFGPAPERRRRDEGDDRPGRDRAGRPRSRSSRGAERGQDRRATSGRKVSKHGKVRRRSRRSRPIGPGERPGQGVRRPRPDDG